MSKYQFELRRQTAAAWTAANPVLADGEPGIETDTRTWKVGDGATAWNSLAYFNPGATGATGAAGAAGIGMAVPLVSGTWSAAGIGGSFSTSQPANGVEIAVPWIPNASGHVDQLQVECVTTPGSAGAVSRLGLRAATASLRPGTLLLDFGTTTSNMESTGSKPTAVAGSPPAVVAGTLYFLSAVTQGNPSPTLPAYRVISAVHPLVISAAATAQAGRSGYSHTGITAGLADWDSTFTIQASVPIIQAHAV